MDVLDWLAELSKSAAVSGEDAADDEKHVELVQECQQSKAARCTRSLLSA